MADVKIEKTEQHEELTTKKLDCKEIKTETPHFIAFVFTILL